MDFKAYEAAPGISVVVLPDTPVFTLAAVSDDFIAHFGMKRKDIIGKGFSEIMAKTVGEKDLVGEQDINGSFEFVIQHKARHEIPILRTDLFPATGKKEQKSWQIKNVPVLSENGEVIYIIHAISDITETLMSEKKIEVSRGIEKAYNFFMNAPVIIGFLNGDDYIIEFANEELLGVWGRESDVIGKPLFVAIPELETQGFIELLNEVRRTGNPYYASQFPIMLNRHGISEILYFDFVYKPVYGNADDPKKATGIISVGHDVTAQVTANKKVSESDAKYRALFDTMSQGAVVLDVIFDEGNIPVDYRFLETNKVFEKQTGLQNAEGKTARALVPNLEPVWFERYGSVALTGEPIRFVERSAAMGRWFDVSAFPLFYDGSTKVAVLFADISERKNWEEALTLSENNLRNIILQSPVAMAILRGPSFIIEIANNRMYELWGRSMEELLNKSIFEALPEVKDQGYENLLEHVYATGETFSAQGLPVTVPRGEKVEKVYINLLYEPFRDGDKNISGVMAVATDVTEQVLARMKLEKINQEVTFLTDFMPQIIWSTKPNGDHDFYNRKWYEYTGLTYDQSKDTGWNTILHPDDQEKTWRVWRHSLNTGDAYNIEYRLKRFDGSYNWFLGRALPLKDEAGTILKWYGTCTDIDDQKKSADLLEEMVKERTQELESQKKELELSNKNLEEFAYAASHDLKEPIRKIRIFSDRLRDQLQDRLHENDQLFFQRMLKATERMQLLIDDLLAYSHVSSSDAYFEEINLNKKVKQVLEDLEVQIEENDASIEVGTLPVIRGHRRQIQQLFQNLITNALKFKKTDLPPEIKITSTVVNAAEIGVLNIPFELVNHSYHFIQLSDNGIGFEQKHADKIFKMFQRLHSKADYEGTGIGLAIVRKVVENHKGFIIAEGKPGEGATFKILLPVI